MVSVSAGPGYQVASGNAPHAYLLEDPLPSTSPNLLSGRACPGQTSAS